MNKISKTILLRGAAALCLLVATFAQSQAWAAPPPLGATISNTAIARYNDKSGSPMTPASSTVDFVVGGSGALTITITDSPDPVHAGNNITYTITVTNNGSVPLTALKLADTIPAKTTFVSADAGGVLSGGEATWAIGGLGVGESLTVHLVVQTDNADPDGLVVTIPDVARALANGVAEKTVSTATTVISRTPGIVKFCDPSWAKVWQYNIGDMIYVQVTDLDRNTDPVTAQTITAVVEHYHGEGELAAVDDTVEVTLTETDVNTGIFHGSLPSDGGPPRPDGTLSLEVDSKIEVIYTDPLDFGVARDDAAYIDPYGKVFDAVTGKPVAGAVVHFIDAATGMPAKPPLVPAAQPSTVTTGADGKFHFPLVKPHTYRFFVTPGAAYAFPSVIPTAALPSGYIIGVGSRGEDFTIMPGDPPLNLDVPVDPSGGRLTVTKTANATTASIGDIVRYTVKVSNVGLSTITSVTAVDIMPHGVFYLKGSTTVDGKPAPDPTPSGSSDLVFTLGALAPGKTVEISYSAVVGPDSQNGDGKNAVYAQGTFAGGKVTSPRAVFGLKVSEGLFTSRGTVIGKVFMDKDKDGVQDEGEQGVPGVTLYMEDGTNVTTGKDGKYSVIGIVSGIHVIKVDDLTLPKDVTLLPASNRFMGDGGSQFVDMPQGGLVKADFAVAPDNPSPPAPAKDGDKADEGKSADATVEDPLVKAIKDMTPELEILEPRDGQVAFRKHINVVVKFPAGRKLTLFVNGEEVGGDSVGMSLVYHKVALSKYLAVSIDPEANNVIKAECRDPFGNVKGVKEITVIMPGKPAKLTVTPDRAEAIADGVTVTEFKVAVYDDAGNLVGTPHEVTVDASAGEVVDKDNDLSTPGVQVYSDGGPALVHIRSPRTTQEARITFSCAKAQESIKFFFAPYLRDMLIVGVGELTAGYGTTRGNAQSIEKDRPFDSGLYAKGRGAFFMKGNIGGGVLLTAAYDSEKKKQDDGLFREKVKDVESEARYPIYGDDSKAGYDALSTERFYLRLDKGRSYLMYGDYQTDLCDTKLSAYKRTFNGLKSVVDTEMFKAKGFAAYTDHTQVVDRLQGKGIAGYYFLDSTPIVEGSETVVIETRDHLRPEHVIKRVVKNRWSDYYVDYALGAILFKEPVPSHDENYDMVYIIVSYESAKPGSRHYIYGGRAAITPTSWFEAGFTGVVEEKDASDYRLLGADATLRLPYKTTVKAEWAKTESLFTEKGIFTPRRGGAWSVRLESHPLDKLNISGYYEDIGRWFDNPSAFEVMRGKVRYGADVRYDMGKDTALFAKFLSEDDRLNNMGHLYASAGVEASVLKNTKIALEYVHEESNDKFVPVTSPNTRFPFDISAETPNRVDGLRLRLETKLWKDLTVSIQHTQDILHNKDNISEAGLDYQFNKTTKFYVREQYLANETHSHLRSVIGEESAILPNTVAYSEYRLAGGADGEVNQHSMGLRNKFNLGYGITGNIAVEKIKSINGQENKNNPDALAVSTGVEYLPMDDLKCSARVEYRSSKKETSRLAEMGITYKLYDDLSALFSGRYFDDVTDGSGTRTMVRASAGLAYRPTWTDTFNALLKGEYKHERNPGDTSGLARDSFIMAVEGVYEPVKGLQLVGKYAGKLTKTKDFSSYTDLISARVIYDVTERVDVGITFRMLTNHSTGVRSYGGSAEVGYMVVRNVWLSAGYSFDKFDADLTRDDFSGQGPYIKVRVKFDENSIRKSAKK